jgi:hypothetical protein
MSYEDPITMVELSLNSKFGLAFSGLFILANFGEHSSEAV